jgi:two-component system, chemotaxis family, protein-glutamate methylesterase/glutaminase
VPPQNPLRVLVVDDSAYNRKNIADILAGNDEIEVVGKAGDGDEALRLVSQLKPDAITLDLEMPRMDGFTFLRILMSKQPTPVIVVSSYSHKENVFKALELGALDFVAKPDRQFSPEGPIRREILQKVLLVRSLRPLGIPSAPAARFVSQPDRPSDPAAPRAVVPLRYIVAVASSTGGPSALVDIFSRLPDRLPAALLIAQHMPEKFTRTFAERLDKKGALRVVEAGDGDIVQSRRGFVCPGKMCMELTTVTGGTPPAGWSSELRLRVASPTSGDRYVPSADRLLRSVAQVAGSKAIGIILTGMGDDGVAGARAIRAAGGTVIAESEQTAVVYGMPGAAVRAGLANETLPLPAIGDYLAALA